MTPSGTGADSSQPAVKNKSKAKDVIPMGEQELGTIGLAAADAWDASPLLPLLWCSKAQFRAAMVAFVASIGTADTAGDGISPAAARLAELDVEVDRNLKFVRNYLLETHGTKAKARAYYGTFGLDTSGQLRAGHAARAEDLTKLVAALKTSDYDQNKYGTAFWQVIEKEYGPLAATSGTARGGSSVQTGTKNKLEKPARKMLRALRQHIKTNFPDTYQAEWRGFGYLQESY